MEKRKKRISNKKRHARLSHSHCELEFGILTELPRGMQPEARRFPPLLCAHGLWGLWSSSSPYCPRQLTRLCTKKRRTERNFALLRENLIAKFRFWWMLAWIQNAEFYTNFDAFCKVLKLIFLMDRQLSCNSNHHPLASTNAFIEEWNKSRVEKVRKNIFFCLTERLEDVKWARFMTF